MSNKRGRPNEYGTEKALRTTLSFDPTLWKSFTNEWQKRGSKNWSKCVQSALRLWLQMESSKPEMGNLKIPAATPDSSGAAHVHVTMPLEFQRALNAWATKHARSIPDVMREALALFIRRNGSAPEFKGLEEWRFMRDDPTEAELAGMDGETAPAKPQSKT